MLPPEGTIITIGTITTLPNARADGIEMQPTAIGATTEATLLLPVAVAHTAVHQGAQVAQAQAQALLPLPLVQDVLTDAKTLK